MAKLNLGRIVGRSAYEEAVRLGFNGTESEWLETLTSYGIAVKNGYKGTETEWLKSLNGTTAYESAVKGGYKGTEESFNAVLNSFGNLPEILDFINGEVV